MAEGGYNQGPYGSHGMAPSGYQMGTAPHHHPGHSENLVSVFCENNPNYRLAMTTEGLVLAFKNPQDPKQQWVKIDKGDEIKDQEGYPGFILVNKFTGQAVSHGSTKGDAVVAEPYEANSLDSSIIWSQGRDEGKGYTAIRLVTNVHLNLDADHGDKKHGGVEDGNRLVIHNWNDQDNQKWKIVPVGSE